MDNSYPNPAPGDYPQVTKKTALLRLAVIVLALLATHVLLLRLHPLGQHHFFSNLVLGALCFWAVIRVVMPRFKDTSAEIQTCRRETML